MTSANRIPGDKAAGAGARRVPRRPAKQAASPAGAAAQQAAFAAAGWPATAPASPSARPPQPATGGPPQPASAARARPAAPSTARPPQPATGGPPQPASAARARPAAPSLAAQTPGTGPAGPASAAAPEPARRPDLDLFARYTRAYATSRAGQQVAILAAGAVTATDLGTDALGSGGSDISLTLIDDDQPVTRTATQTRASLRQCVLGDLRTAPLPPRSFDIVQCSSLLERIKHTELVLDRLISALKPGGLLLLRIRDRDSAAGFLDRALPTPARRAVWRRRRPGEPGPHPAVYERLASGRGVHDYALLRGLVIAERLALGGLAGGLPPGPPGFLAAQQLLGRLSRGRLTAAHEELLYVLRKPENRFARIL